MSSMLEEAIIDAEALKEAAQKSAEEKIIEYFSKDIKEAVDIILEQDPMALPAPGLAATMAPTQAYIPQTTSLLATPPGQALVDIEAQGKDTHEGESIVKQAPYAATTSERDVVSIDLDKLEETIGRNLQEDGGSGYEYGEYDEGFEFDDNLLEEDDDEYSRYDEGFELDDDLLEEYGVGGDDDEGDQPKPCAAGETRDFEGNCVAGGSNLEEGLELEEMIRSILAEEGPLQEEFVEKTPEEREKEKKAAAKKRGAPYQPAAKKYCEDFDERERPEGCTPKEARFKKGAAPLVKEHKQLNNKVKLLEQKLNKYQEVFPHLKHQLEESNLHNARLHYQNRVLNSDSLNERQKDRLVETISKANTVEEAKIIYETLQSAVGASAMKRRPQSLNEVVTKSSSAFMPRKEEKRVDPLAVRMKVLAGITDK